ncbi:hypothetical protein phi1422_0035 [Bdellovibrio phage phi1422]|uniref:hypothetical protein n=1 Tax=Bdellovibrio phage phi1422 TaxID=1127515 RepID=UPI0002536D57|nr:hypothetical protein F395_gp35 [Bdellovibrio phage phi1422]AFC22555.1 hypothetical protein phi1422_0035 [Bdellovibrio phage phi1422]
MNELNIFLALIQLSGLAFIFASLYSQYRIQNPKTQKENKAQRLSALMIDYIELKRMYDEKSDRYGDLKVELMRSHGNLVKFCVDNNVSNTVNKILSAALK